MKREHMLFPMEFILAFTIVYIVESYIRGYRLKNEISNTKFSTSIGKIKI